MQDKVLILDFGSQYTQLIARRVRELFIYCEIHPFNNPPKNTEEFNAVILSGSPIQLDPRRRLIPTFLPLEEITFVGGLLWCAVFAHFSGGAVKPSNTREYGRANLSFIQSGETFFEGIDKGSQVWMSHSDTIDQLPDRGILLASTEDVKNAAYCIEGETSFGIQFHPEVYHTTDGKKLLENFLIKIAGVQQDWTPDSFVEMTVKEIRETVGDQKVILGLSGGVDSTVAAVLLHKAIGPHLQCIFVNNGLLRKMSLREY